MTTHTMTEAKNDICLFFREAENIEVSITRQVKPAADSIGFHDEDWLNYRVRHDVKILRKVAKTREEIRMGQSVILDELPD